MEGKKRKGREGVVMHGETGEWEVETVLEDDGTVVSGATVAVHDVETGRLFMGGVLTPFISVCETR
jgi:hypothetical protein